MKPNFETTTKKSVLIEQYKKRENMITIVQCLAYNYKNY